MNVQPKFTLREMRQYPSIAMTPTQYFFSSAVGLWRRVSGKWHTRCQQWGKAAGDELANDVCGCQCEFAYCLFRRYPWLSAFDVKAKYDAGREQTRGTKWHPDYKPRLMIHSYDEKHAEQPQILVVIVDQLVQGPSSDPRDKVVECFFPGWVYNCEGHEVGHEISFRHGQGEKRCMAVELEQLRPLASLPLVPELIERGLGVEVPLAVQRKLGLTVPEGLFDMRPELVRA